MDLVNPNGHWDKSWLWLCQRRKHHPHNADVWDLRFHWPTQGDLLLNQVLAGEYRLSPMQIFNNGLVSHAVWTARDALVLKWLSLEIAPLLPIHARCTHAKGNGGTYSALSELGAALRSNSWKFVCKTDIKGYYGNMRKHRLQLHLDDYITHPVLSELLRQWLYYSVEQGGLFHTPVHGIARGCAVSPLVGASLLHHIDDYFSSTPDSLCYLRYMDDFIFLTHDRWRLRRAVKRLHQFFHPEAFEFHPDKTFIVRIDKGFDWLGIWFGNYGQDITISSRTLEKHYQQRALRYLALNKRHLPDESIIIAMTQYDKRWQQWAASVCRVASGTV